MCSLSFAHALCLPLVRGKWEADFHWALPTSRDALHITLCRMA